MINKEQLEELKKEAEKILHTKYQYHNTHHEIMKKWFPKNIKKNEGVTK